MSAYLNSLFELHLLPSLLKRNSSQISEFFSKCLIEYTQVTLLVTQQKKPLKHIKKANKSMDAVDFGSS